MNIKIVFFFGFIVGAVTTLGVDNLVNEKDSISSLPPLSLTPEAINNPPPTQAAPLAPKATELTATKDNTDAFQATEDISIQDFLELKSQEDIDEALKIERDIEGFQLSITDTIDQYEPMTGKTYDELEQEEQVEARQYMVNHDDTIGIIGIEVTAGDDGTTIPDHPIDY